MPLEQPVASSAFLLSMAPVCMRYIYILLIKIYHRLKRDVQNNTLVSSDNKGMAAYLYESSVEPNAMPGNTTFVAGFAQCE
jgi:hypothetical protein